MGIYFNAYAAIFEIPLSTIAFLSLMIFFSLIRHTQKRADRINERNGELGAEMEAMRQERAKMVAYLQQAFAWYQRAKATDKRFEQLFTSEAFLLFEDDIRMTLKREGKTR